MARSFATVTGVPFAGNLVDLPAQARNTGFGKQKAELPPTIITVPIGWASYGANENNPNIAVQVTGLQGGGARQLLDKILSVRIDNLGNDVPVYVYFSDTGYTVACPPNTIVWDSVQTGKFNALIIGEGFSNTPGATSVYFCNFAQQPFVNNEIIQVQDLWLASAEITRGNSIFQQNFGIPALGDQFVQAFVDPTINDSTAPVFSLGAGFVYITELVITVAEMSLVNSTPGQFAIGNAIFESTGASGEFSQAFFGMQGAINPPLVDSKEIFRVRGNFKLDATQQWQFRWNHASINTTNFAGGIVRLDCAFTTNPQ